jgi:hypothetical protein
MDRLDHIRLKALATIAFVSSFFFAEISSGGQPLISIPLYQIEPLLMIGLAVLAYGVHRPSVNQTRRLVGVLALLAVVQLAYFLGLNAYPIAGSLTDYVIGSVHAFGYVVSVTIYACLFFDEDLLLRSFYALGRLCLGIGLVAFLAHEVAGLQFLLDFAYGSPRTQAFFTEPSATAPAVTVVGIVAWKRRDWIGLALAAAFIVTTRSPTALIVLFFSVVGLYLVRRGPWVLWSGVVGTISSLVAFVVLGGLEWLKTAPYFGITINRLARGVEFAITLSQQGYNARFAGAINVYEHLQEHGLLWIGYGFNSASPYFRHAYTGAGTAVQDYSLLITLFFSFGIIGVSIFLTYAYRAAMSMQRSESVLLYLFVPFFLTSMINSAQGFNTYKFVLLAIVVYGVGKKLKYDHRYDSESYLAKS